MMFDGTVIVCNATDLLGCRRECGTIEYINENAPEDQWIFKADSTFPLREFDVEKIAGLLRLLNGS